MSHPIAAALASADPNERRAACAAAVEDPSAVLLADALAARLGDPVKAVVRAASDALVAIGRRSGGVARRAAFVRRRAAQRGGDRVTHCKLRAARRSRAKSIRL